MLLLTLGCPVTFSDAERVAVNGSASVFTSNASLAIEGVAGPVVIANAGTCNLRLPPGGQMAAQPCLITGSPPPTQAKQAVGAVAQAAGTFNQTCGFDRESSSEGVCGLMSARAEACIGSRLATPTSLLFNPGSTHALSFLSSAPRLPCQRFGV